mmetsp:Transcript_10541/g.11592  ORF Transcript_10541/g.11592 Transcript_10541/m.11592 type:complete len:127 (-) Transcript_10541:238-618(-)
MTTTTQFQLYRRHWKCNKQSRCTFKLLSCLYTFEMVSGKLENRLPDYALIKGAPGKRPQYSCTYRRKSNGSQLRPSTYKDIKNYTKDVRTDSVKIQFNARLKSQRATRDQKRLRQMDIRFLIHQQK